MHLAPAVISFIWHVLVGLALQQPFETSKIDPIAQGVLNRALADNIDLTVHSFTAAALADIVFWSHFEPGPEHEYALEANATGAIDTHAHYVPEWYAKLRGDNTKWSLEEHLSLMKCRGIATTIFDIPNPNIFPKDANATVAIARLLNENLAALSKALPRKFGFFATVPLPYVDEAIVETTYALKHLNALAVALSSNHEGQYLGDPLFRPFFSVLNDLQAIVFLHPNEPLIEVDGSLIKANPTRAIPPGELWDDAMYALRTRCWWDSAGLTYAHQIGGLLAYNISASHTVFGTDYPYLSVEQIQTAAQAISDSPFMTWEEKESMKGMNARRLFGNIG